VLHAIPGDISLNEPIGDAGFDIEDTMADPRATHVDDALMAQSFRRLLAMSLAQLSPRERYVVERRFGLRGRGDIRPGEAGPFHGSVPHDEFLPSTLAEIGTELDLSRERVRQIEARALGKLRQSDRAHQLRLFLGVNLN
jgi:RNA polymerase sigma factor (sigma-70 family)